MALAGVGDAAAVTQLIGQAIGLVAMIVRAVETARQNRLECEHLASRLSTVHGVLSNLPQYQEVAPPLKVLNNTLEEAHHMVIACRNRGAASQFFGYRRHADCFNQINVRIACDVVILNLSLSSYMARRHSNQVVLDPGHIIGVPTAMAPWPGFSSGSLQAQMVVSQAQSQVSPISSDNPRALTWSEIAAATSFAVELGRGRSGRVYKGRLHFQHGTEVAVKVLEKHGRQGVVEDAFVADSNILSGLRHDHIVRLVGWCAEKEHRMLVYEHMGSGTLRDHLQHLGGGPSSSPVTASWETRVEVLLGVARAIHYLHRGADPLVIHRNVSSSNILLDANWTPRLSGFGAAVYRAAGEEEHGHGGQLVEEVVGTPGYIDPEYGRTRRVSPASDVYSFGVVMLEALTGRPPDVYGVTLGLLVDSALPIIHNGKLREVLDGLPALQPTRRQLDALDVVAHTASYCLCPRRQNRLAMCDVVANLQRALHMIRSNS